MATDRINNEREDLRSNVSDIDTEMPESDKATHQRHGGESRSEKNLNDDTDFDMTDVEER